MREEHSFMEFLGGGKMEDFRVGGIDALTHLEFMFCTGKRFSCNKFLFHTLMAFLNS